MENTDSTPDLLADCGSHDASPECELPRSRRRSRPWESSELSNRLAESEPGSASLRSIEDSGVLNGSSTDSSLGHVVDQAEQNETSVKIPRRWDRFVRLMGEPAVRTLMNSHVVVFGLGGVGSYAAESLARSAVGSLTLVDFDDVCVTNVNRQLQAFPGTVGQSKSELLGKRIQAINPDAVVDPVQAFYGPDNSAALLSPRPDYVIDAIDNVTAKLHLLTTCLQAKIPVVSVTGSGGRLDPTQVEVADVSKTKGDPLARVMRKELSRRGFDTSRRVGLPVVFSNETVMEPISPGWDADGFRCICPHAEDSPHACEKRRMIYGTASFVTSTFGMAATSVVIRGLTGNSAD